MMPLSKRRRKAVAALACAGIAASLCLRSLVSPGGEPSARETTSPRHAGHDDGAKTAAVIDVVDDAEIAEDADKFHRGLRLRLNLRSFVQGSYVEEADYDAAFEAAFSGDPGDDAAIATQRGPVQPYTLEDALSEAQVWAYTFAIVVYDPPGDKFVVLYSKDHMWKNGNAKLFTSIREFTYLLRRLFPERFTPQSPEFVVALGSGDYPHVRSDMLPRGADGIAPVLMFGSAFREGKTVYPNMIPMPMPACHLPCFVKWVADGRERGVVCEALGTKASGGSLIFGEEFGLRWDDLTPQLIWRGTDFSFLPSLQPRKSLVHPDARNFVRTDRGKVKNKRADAVRKLNRGYDTLIPRWKGVALSADAELEAQGTGRLAWADIRFSSHLDGGKSPTIGSPKYALWESVGMATGSGMPPVELAKYKYHIDLGGGGGTTWTGTIEKLAMPGLLFHHVTPMKDYYHDRLVPWRHYIPVGTDLKDLRRKFDWAEGHPEQARRIADAGTEFMRHLGTPEGFGEMFDEDFVEPLRRVIEAYRPVLSVRGDASVSWMDVLNSMPDSRVIKVMECSGLSPYHSCSFSHSEEVLKFQSTGRYQPS